MKMGQIAIFDASKSTFARGYVQIFSNPQRKEKVCESRFGRESVVHQSSFPYFFINSTCQC